MTDAELGYSSEALPLQLHSSRATPAKSPSEDLLMQVTSILGSGLVIRSPECRELDFFFYVHHSCINMDDYWHRNDGGPILSTFLTVRTDLAYKPTMLCCFHYYKTVTSSMSLSVPCGEFSKNCSTPQRS